MTNGGKRKGAGRPKGTGTRIKVADYFNKEEILQLFTDLKKQAKKNPKVAMFLADHLAGKAAQAIEGVQDGQPIVFEISSEIANKHKLK